MEAVNTSSPSQLDLHNVEQLYPELFSTLTGLATGSDAELTARFVPFVADLSRDFAIEEQWLQYLDPAAQKAHRAEHAQLLRLLHHAEARMLNGDCMLARKIVPLLAQWFAEHIAELDTIWAHSLSHAKNNSFPVMLDAA